MCAIVNSSLLIIFLILWCLSVVSVGLPYRRQERGAYEDILSGADFLSVFMGSDYPQMGQQTTPRYVSAVTLEDALRTLGLDVNNYPDDDESRYTRGSRSTSYVVTSPSYDGPTYQTYASKQQYYDQGSINIGNTKIQLNENNDNMKDVSISVVSAEEPVDKQISESNILEDTTEVGSTTEITTTIPTDKPVVISEEQPSIVVESNKSEFSIDEGEPITKISDSPAEEFSHEYPASVQALPSPHSISSFRSNNEFSQHHTVIYHDNQQDNGQARSVSYSTVIQTVPNQQVLSDWNEDEKMPHHERQERHYGGTQVSYENNFNKFSEKPNMKPFGTYKTTPNITQVKEVGMKPLNSMAESKDYFVTSKYNPSEFNDSADKKLTKNEPTWEKPEEPYGNPESTSRKASEPTERSWEVQSKPYISANSKRNQVPIIYGRPEQNYEVDESVSVVTNGRTHGIQGDRTIIDNNNQQPPLPPLEVNKNQQQPKKADDNQKVGYVVEGRNYRKYRVEERTSDGFIVGEYGVVSHDDGSLRGVRYTADGTINPRLIYDALMKFLSL